MASMFTFNNIVQGLCVAVFLGIVIMKLRAPKLKLPPGPFALPIVGNWLQVRLSHVLVECILKRLHYSLKSKSKLF